MSEGEKTFVSDDPNPINVTEYETLLLNLLGGLRPQDLKKEEVELLEEEVGEDWYEKMGFDKFAQCERPSFDN